MTIANYQPVTILIDLVVSYLQHGRTHPTGAPTYAHDQTYFGW